MWGVGTTIPAGAGCTGIGCSGGLTNPGWVPMLCKAVPYICMECLGVNLLHICVYSLDTTIHNCSSSGSLFFTTLRWNN